MAKVPGCPLAERQIALEAVRRPLHLGRKVVQSVGKHLGEEHMPLRVDHTGSVSGHHIGLLQVVRMSSLTEAHRDSMQAGWSWGWDTKTASASMMSLC